MIPDETGGYTVEVPSLPGCFSEGDTREEALTNIQDAIEGFMDVLKADGLPIPEEASSMNVDPVKLL
ncbi:MAG: type II toxin-antitoxin system HicB family antitoxin [Aggregatilineales bacterium]